VKRPDWHRPGQHCAYDARQKTRTASISKALQGTLTMDRVVAAVEDRAADPY
jgi:hypothetical protein